MRAGILLAVYALAAVVVSQASRAQMTDATRASATGGPPASTAPVPRALRRSVGQLWVPATRFRDGYAEHFDEHCSATLVTTDPAAGSRLLLSAWHCIEDYRDLSRDLHFETGDGRRHPARVLASGGGMQGDWAILKLQDTLPGGLLIEATGAVAGDAHAMAGFPRREDGAAILVLHRDCRVTGRDGKDLRSDCVLSKGASGGAVVDAVDATRLRGVISRGDAASVSIFVPLTRFYRRLRPFLETQTRAVAGS